MPESPIFRHRVWFPFIFLGIVPEFPLFSSALRLDLISLPKTRPIFSYLFWHRVQIPLAFSCSVPGSFSPSVIMAHSLSLFMVVWGQNCWSLEFFTRVHFTHSFLHFAFVTHSFIHSTKEEHICKPSILSLDTCILSYGCHMHPCFHMTPPWPLFGLDRFLSLV